MTPVLLTIQRLIALHPEDPPWEKPVSEHATRRGRYRHRALLAYAKQDLLAEGPHEGEATTTTPPPQTGEGPERGPAVNQRLGE
jgi:hypothetical protein